MSMVLQPCHSLGSTLVEAYIRRIKGEGLTYQDWLQHWFWCPECGEYMATGSLQMHHHTQNGV